jgi:hypothetical protein
MHFPRAIRFAPALAGVAVVAVIVTAALCAGSDRVTRACTTGLVVAGYCNMSFKCENDTCYTGEDRYEVEQDLSDLTRVTATIVASSLPGDVGVVFEGELCDTTFTSTASDPGNDEEGTWVFSDNQHLTKRTTFDNGEFTCVGIATKEPLPLAAPLACPVP